MNSEGAPCGNPDCDKKMQKNKGFYALGSHEIVCSDRCEHDLLKAIAKPKEVIPSRT
jgi:hypothetical protein